MIRGFGCLDCKKDTINEYYMIHDRIWLKVNPKDKGMLCIKCLESRLKRKLRKKDFTDAPVNHDPLWSWSQTQLLLSRLK